MTLIPLSAMHGKEIHNLNMDDKNEYKYGFIFVGACMVCGNVIIWVSSC